jgi:cytochrome b6
MAKVYNWFQERLEIQSIADDISVNMFHLMYFLLFWWNCIYLFLVQVATGFAMTFTTDHQLQMHSHQ